jgi:hypothetical protein
MLARQPEPSSAHAASLRQDAVAAQKQAGSYAAVIRFNPLIEKLEP